MPGTLVRDALAPALHTGATLNAAGSTNGTAVEVSKPGDVRVFLVTSTVTGTTPTLDVELQGADDTAFTVNKVSYGRFAQLSGGSQSAVTRVLDMDVFKRYMRAVVTVGGTTPVYTGTTIYVREGEDRMTPLTDTA